MSTTTSTSTTVARIAGGALLIWFVGVAAMTAFVEPTAEVIVLAPATKAAALLSNARVAILDNPGGFLLVRGESPGFVQGLYASGAWLVLPATSGGCRGGYRRLAGSADRAGN